MVSTRFLQVLVTSLAFMAAATEVAALPTRRSTSTVARRARMNRRQSAAKSLQVEATSPSTGKTHSVFVDASESVGGIQGSTVNINIARRRAATAGVVRNPKARRAAKRAVPVASDKKQQRRAPIAAPAAEEGHKVHIDASGIAGGINGSTLNTNISGRKERRATEEGHKVHIDASGIAGGINGSTVNINISGRNKKRTTDSNGVVTDLAAQEAAYKAAVAALGDSTATAATTEPIAVNFHAATPSNETITTNATTIATATQPANITLTLTLVPQATGGYIDAALLDNLPSASSSAIATPVASASSSAVTSPAATVPTTTSAPAAAASSTSTSTVMVTVTASPSPSTAAAVKRSNSRDLVAKLDFERRVKRSRVTAGRTISCVVGRDVDCV